jgi:peptidoglycan/xylan/chitin deacetylase (PgdA/CDA1 family)
MRREVRLVPRRPWPDVIGGLWGRVARPGAGPDHRAAILVYHRVTEEARSAIAMPPWRFRQQMNYLRLHYRVVALADLVAALRRGERLSAPTVAITFDDGYRDNLTEAAPILGEFGLPATLFVATDPQERGEPFWWDLLALAGITDPATLALLKTRPHDEFRRAIAVARQGLDPAALADATRRLYLSWDEIRRWVALGHDLGAHTVTHPILSRVSDEGVRAELRESRAAITRETGLAIDLFAYPNGRAIDFTAETLRIVAEEGFRAACTTIEGLNDATSDPLALGRFSARDEPLPLFALRLSGHLGGVKRWATRRVG